jgi:hypothetical protein
MCPNRSCGRVFTSPLKAENIGSKKSGAYDACPYCLTEVTLEENPAVAQEKEKPKTKKVEAEVEELTVHPGAEKPVKAHPATLGCEHHFGYLSERSSKEKIPEECMTCEKIVQCMLKNVTS